MMKKLLYIFIVAIMFCSCDTWLDVKPKGTVIPKTANDLEKLILFEVGKCRSQ